MKHIKNCHIQKHNLESFLDTYLKKPVEIINPLSIEEILVKAFGNKKLTYKEMCIKKANLIRLHQIRTYRRYPVHTKEYTKNKEVLTKMFRDKVLNSLSQKTLDMYKILYSTVPIDTLNKGGYSNHSLEDLDLTSAIFWKRAEINQDQFLHYANTYYTLKEEFLIDIIIVSLNSSLEILEMLRDKLNLELNIKDLFDIVTIIHYGIHYSPLKIQLNKTIRNILIDKMLSAELWIDEKQILLLENLPKILNLDSDQIKSLDIVKIGYAD